MQTPQVESADVMKPPPVILLSLLFPIHPATLPVVSEWCQSASIPTMRYFTIPPIRLIYAESKRVTDGTRTRDLRSHNPTTSVAAGCCGLQNQLI
jgi:hypothetical protein